MVVEITVVQFKQLRTTTPKKKKNEGPHLYTATNEYHRFNMYNKNTSMEIVHDKISQE